MSALLELKDVATFYGASQALFGISLEVHAGEVVTLIGRNGMGKSTTVKSIMGLQAARSGRIAWGDVSIHALPAHRVAQAGIGLVPEGRHVFPNLTVQENLLATAANRRHAPQPWTLERIYTMFPRLRERARNLGCNLSGGEQQMLAIGRALMTNPLLLILDEATEGLAPLIRDEIWASLRRLKEEGMALIVIDKHIAPLLRLANRHYVIEKGRVVWQGDSAQLQASPDILRQYVGM
ncbi:MAG: ABC transporter ATP-binding protein [Pseudomonadota bacterium]